MGTLGIHNILFHSSKKELVAFSNLKNIILTFFLLLPTLKKNYVNYGTLRIIAQYHLSYFCFYLGLSRDSSYIYLELKLVKPFNIQRLVISLKVIKLSNEFLLKKTIHESEDFV